jgi:hypothetical protein
MRRRAERLLGGERNTSDLYALFLWLRERSFGNKTVADIGDFLAHSEEREQGITWNTAQAFFDHAGFTLPRFGKPPGHKPFTFAEFQSSALAALELLPPGEVKSGLGIGKDAARKALKGALSCIADFNGASIAWRKPPTPLEQRVLKYFGGRLVIKPAFTSQDLVSEFVRCLIKNRLIGRAPQELPKSFGAFVALYAVERMHLARILLRDGKVATLEAHISLNRRDGVHPIDVMADVPLPDGGWLFPIYGTNLDGREWCEPELWPISHNAALGWNFPLEIGPSGKLRKL